MRLPVLSVVAVNAADVTTTPTLDISASVANVARILRLRPCLGGVDVDSDMGSLSTLSGSRRPPLSRMDECPTCVLSPLHDELRRVAALLARVLVGARRGAVLNGVLDPQAVVAGH